MVTNYEKSIGGNEFAKNLTKLEFFTGLAMLGFLANGKNGANNILVTASVSLAKRIITRLEEEESNEELK